MKSNATLAALTAAVLLCGNAGGCATKSRPVATAGQGELILVCELKPDAEESAVVPAANELSKLPGVLDVTAAVGHHTSNSAAGGTVVGPGGTRVTFVATLKDGNASGQSTVAWSKALTDGGYMDKIARVDAYDGTLQNYLIAPTFIQETTASDLQRRSDAIREQNELRNRTK